MQLLWLERTTTCMICLKNWLPHWTVLLQMPNQRDRIFVFDEHGMRNCDIARNLGVASPNVSRAVKQFQELGHTGDCPRSSRKCVHNHQKVRAHTCPTKFDTVYAKNCRRNQHLARIGPRNSQTIGRNSGRTSYKLFNFWRLKISEYDWKDVDDTFVSSHLWTGREVCSRMKNFSPSNKPTIIRTTRAGASRLPTLNSAIVEHAKIQSP